MCHYGNRPLVVARFGRIVFILELTLIDNYCRNCLYSVGCIRGLTINFATHCGESATYLIAEYHCGRLQSTPPWEAMHRYQRLVHPSKQFWNWFCGMAFRAAVVLLLMSSMSSKYLHFNISFIFGNRKKSLLG